MSAGDVLLFCAFELGFVVVPGCLAYVALSGGPRTLLRVAVVGCALGFTLQVGFYIASAWSGVDAVLWVYPALVGVPALAVLWRRRERPLLEARSWSGLEVAVAAGLALAAVLILAIRLYDQPPLPGDAFAYRYYPDLVWEVAVAGEAKHVWPLDIPALAGLTFHYHYFANLNEAAISLTTGITQPVVNWRLAPIPLLLVVVGGLLELGRMLGRRGWAGIAALALVLFVGRFDPLPIPPGEFFRDLYLSDSFLFGLAVFLALA